jgi:hypothetical protein
MRPANALILLVAALTGWFPNAVQASDAEFERTAFPAGVLFEPPLADPKQTHSYFSLHRFDIEARERFTAGSVAFGKIFGLTRWSRASDGSGWQLSLDGGVFAQFDLSSESRDLLNADYVIGLQVEHLRGNLSTRFRLYHQSTHLGDELLLRSPELIEQRVNFSYQSLQFLASYSRDPWRVYGGGEYLIDRDPADLKRAGLQAGGEFRGRNDLLGGRPVAAIDLRSFEHHQWDPGISAKLGLEFGDRLRGSGRRIRILIEFYDGFVPFGQFYELTMTSYGLGVYFGL